MKDSRKIGTIEDRSTDTSIVVTHSQSCVCAYCATPIAPVGLANVSVFVKGPCKVDWRPSPGFVSVQVGPMITILLTTAEEASELLDAAIKATNAFKFAAAGIYGADQ